MRSEYAFINGINDNPAAPAHSFQVFHVPVNTINPKHIYIWNDLDSELTHKM